VDAAGPVVNTTSVSGPIEPVGYAELLEQVKAQVRAARIHAAHAVNSQLITLYWQIGRLILDRQAAEGWGTKVIGRLAADLRTEFPSMRGLSQRNLVYMRTFAATFSEPITQQPVARLPWGHVTVLLDRVTDPDARTWYATAAAEQGWSRATLTHHITAHRYARAGAAPNNFPTTLGGLESDLAREIVHDPYDLDFLALDPGYTERQLEDALLRRLTHFIAELGAGVRLRRAPIPPARRRTGLLRRPAVLPPRPAPLHRLRAEGRRGRTRTPRQTQLLRQRRRRPAAPRPSTATDRASGYCS